MSLLKLPSQKILAQYLQCCVKCADTTCPDLTLTEEDNNITGRGLSGSVTGGWRCQVANLNFPVSVSVWLQGTVIEIKDSGKTVAIDDGTGIIILSNCDSVAVKILIKKGMYLMAVGSIQSVGQQHCYIKPFKLQDLSHDNYAETMWPLEVLDQILFLNSQT